MAFGTFYEVADEARVRLKGLRTKAEWYEAMAALQIEHAAQLDAEEDIQYGWQGAFDEAPAPLDLMFKGELRAEPNEFDDPDVVFLGADLVRKIAAKLASEPDDAFLKLLSADGVDRSASIWLLNPMRDFFANSAKWSSGVIIAWGG